MNDFNDDFDNLDDDNFNDFNSSNSLKEMWQNNPLLKLFIVVAGVIIAITAIFIFTGQDEGPQSKIANAPNKKETLGGEVSQSYAEVLEEVNQQRLQNAVQTGTSTIPLLVNPEEQELLTQVEETPPYEEFDPLATFRAANQSQDPEAVIVENEPIPDEPPVLIPPQQLAPAPQPVAGPGPQAVEALAQAMLQDVGTILSNHDPTAPQIVNVTPADFFETAAFDPVVGDGSDLFPGAGLDVLDPVTDTTTIQEIIIPAGEINYAQLMVEANSDIPGPILAQLVSGPLSGSKLIGSFDSTDEYLILSFDQIVVNGINQPITAVAIDPATTLPGLATEVDRRYWKRAILPAAARFLEGIGAAIAEDTETTVTVSGDTVIEEQDALDFEQELGRGVEEGFSEIADFLDDTSDEVEPLVRVARGTALGILFTNPVLE